MSIRTMHKDGQSKTLLKVPNSRTWLLPVNRCVFDHGWSTSVGGPPCYSIATSGGESVAVHTETLNTILVKKGKIPFTVT